MDDLQVMFTPTGVWVNSDSRCIGRFLETGYEVYDNGRLHMCESGATDKISWIRFINTIHALRGKTYPFFDKTPLWMDDLDFV